MAVVAAYSNASNGVTASGLQDFPGHRILIMLCDRSGGETASIDTSDPDLTAAISQVAAEVTDPTNGTNRRSVFLFDGIVPDPVDTNPIITPTVLDGSSSPVAASIVVAVVEEAATYTLAATANADSAGSTVTSQATGTTGNVAGGDVLAIVAETTRGDTTAVWTTADNTPPNPGGGDWNLSITSGTGASQRRGSVGYYTEAAAASQTWADTVTYGTARMASALIAVWTTGAGGGEEHEGDGAACSVTLTPAAGSGAAALAGSGAAGSTILTPATGQGSPAATGAGQQAQVVLTPAAGTGEASGGGGEPADVTVIVGPTRLTGPQVGAARLRPPAAAGPTRGGWQVGDTRGGWAIGPTRMREEA